MNDFYVGKDREILSITPDEVSIKGKNINKDGKDAKYRMEDTFWKDPDTVNVILGDVRTDDMGRLIVMPGNGAGGSAPPQNPISNFADNDGWYDDWADGYVKATVKLNGDADMEVEPAWVACCGPNYAPEIEPFITMYDVVRDVMVNGKEKPLEQKPRLPLSFTEEVYPLFHRLGLMEWVAAAANLREGWIRTGDFLDDSYMQKLADPSPANLPLREHVFKNFRQPGEYKLYDNANDFEDNIQLHGAKTQACQIFLTSDKKLLKLKSFEQVKIMSPDKLD